MKTISSIINKIKKNNSGKYIIEVISQDYFWKKTGPNTSELTLEEESNLNTHIIDKVYESEDQAKRAIGQMLKNKSHQWFDIGGDWNTFIDDITIEEGYMPKYNKRVTYRIKDLFDNLINWNTSFKLSANLS